ncbi:MAG: DUF4126 domain-containing protein [Phycisphaeraceae bacterium]
MSQNAFEMILALTMGVALAAATGFRVFVPMLVVSIAALAGKVTLAPGFEWIGSWPAVICFAAATALEIAAYYVPWLDHLLDTITTPAALIAGTIVTASFITGMDPMLKWGLAIIAGGGAAGGVQVLTVSARAVSGAATGGLGNPVVSTVEWISATIVAVLAIVAPIIAGLLLLLLVALLVRWFVRRRQARRRPLPVAAGVLTPQAVQGCSHG